MKHTYITVTVYENDKPVAIKTFKNDEVSAVIYDWEQRMAGYKTRYTRSEWEA